MYSVGDQTFPDIQSARAYDYENSGTINNVKAGPAEGFDGTYHDGTVNAAYVQQQESTDEQFTTPTFTFIRGTETGEQAALSTLYEQRTEAEQVTRDDLFAYFNSSEGEMLKRGFGGNFDNYLAYMTERERLIQAGEYDTGNWANADAGLSADDLLLLDPDYDLTSPESADADYIAQLNQQIINAQQGAYNSWIGNPQNTALMEQFGFQPMIMDERGSVYRWNGTAYTRTEKANTGNMGDQMRLLVGMAAGMVLGPAIGEAVVGSATGITSAAAQSVASSMVTQLVTTGDINLESLAQAALTGAVGEFLNTNLSDLINENFPELADLTTGSEVFDNVLAAMGRDALGQAVLTGEIDAASVLQSGFFATAQEALAWFLGEYGTVSDEKAQALWNEGMSAETREAIDAAWQEQFNATVGDLVNQMSRETAAMASENLRQLINGMASDGTLSGANGGNFDDNWYADEDSDAATVVEEAGGYLTPPSQIDNPFEGSELINGVYYNEAGYPIGVHPDATPEQILAQFVNENNAWTTTSGVSAHGLPDEALAVLLGDGDLQSLSDFLVANDLILAQEASGAYILISGASNVTTGFHTSLDQDALLNLEFVGDQRFVPPPTSSEDNPLLDPLDTSDVSEDIRDLLTNVEEQPPILDYDWTDVTFEDLTPEEVVELEEIVENVLSEDPEATLEDVIEVAQQAGVTEANALATLVQNVASSSQEIFEALQNSGVTAEEAAAALVSNGQWTAEDANSALSETGGVDDNPETNPLLEGGGYASPTSNTQYQVGDRYFDNIDDARTYDYNTSGTIDNVTSYTPVDTEISDITDEDSFNTASGIYSAMENSEAARELHSLIQRINDGEITATQEQLNYFIEQWEASTGDMWDDSYLDEDPYEGFEEFDTTDLDSEVSGQLTAAEQNIVLQILNSAATTDRALTETEQRLIDALETGNGGVIKAILQNISAGEQEILDVLEGLNVDVTSVQDQISELSGQLSDTEQNIVNQILESAAAANRDLTETEQNLIDALQSGNSDVVREILNNVSAGEQQILDVLAGLNIDVTDIQDQISGLSGQLTDAEQNIVEQILNSASEANRELTETEQNLIDALNSGNAEVVREILDNISAGEQSILDVLSGLEIDADNIQDQISGLSGQLTNTEQNIVEQILESAAASGRQLTDAEQRIIEALESGDTRVIREVLNNISTGEQDILDVLDGLNIDTTNIRADLSNLSSQLTAAEQNIIEQILETAAASGRQLTESEQSIIDALQSGDVRVVRDVLNGISAGEQSILDGLVSLNIDTSDIQNQLSNLSGQLSDAEQSIVDQILASAQATGRELTESEARLIEALTSGNTATVRDILNGISSGEADIIDDLANLNVDVTSISNSITNLNTSINVGLDGLAEALGIQTSDLIAAIENLGTGLSGDLTGLEGSVLQGLGNLADSLGTDIGTIVGSIEGLGAGIASNIQGLSDFLGTEIGTGFAGLGLEIGEGLEGLGDLIGTGFEGISGDIGAGFEGIGDQLGTGFGGLMLGLAGLGGLIPTQRDIYAATPKERLTYTPIQFAGLDYQKRPQQGMLTTPQAPSAMDALNQFIERNKQA